MSATTLTKAQRIVYDALTEEPRRGVDIANEIGFTTWATNGHLMALGAKGFARKHLNPARWSIGRAGGTDTGAVDNPGSPAARGRT